MAKILFVYDKFNTGGIETLILRMSQWLISHGHELTVVMKKEGEIANMLPSQVNKIVLGRYYSYLYIPVLTKIILKKYSLQTFDTVMSFHPKSNWIASNIIDALQLQCHYISGVYHPRAYYNAGLHLSEKVVYRELLKKAGSQRLLFMNGESQRLHEQHLALDFTESPIWPLPIDTGKSSCMKTRDREEEKQTPMHIVSIGRFAPFKTYNLYMIDIVERLKSEGYDIVYDIYGTGELEEKMRMKIEKLNASSYIKLHGLLPYEALSCVMQDAYVFVGMGTSVLEAALCGVPALVAIENSKEAKSYGYLHELPYYNIGEQNDALAVQDVERLLKRLLSEKRENYLQICKKSREYVEAYSLEVLMPKWFEIVGRTPLEHRYVSRKMRWKYLLFELLNPLLKKIDRRGD